MAWLKTIRKCFSKSSTTQDDSCGICGDKIDNSIELKMDCGGHCWECISEVEADGFDISVEEYRKNYDKSWEDIIAEQRDLSK